MGSATRALAGWKRFATVGCALVAVFGCRSQPATTEVQVHFELGDEVATVARQFIVHVYLKESSEALYEATCVRGEDAVAYLCSVSQQAGGGEGPRAKERRAAFPLTLPIVAPPSDLSAQFRVDAIVSDGQRQARVHAESRFVPAARREIRLRFEIACVGVPCANRQTCMGGTCVDGCFEAQREAKEPSPWQTCLGSVSDAADGSPAATTDGGLPLVTTDGGLPLATTDGGSGDASTNVPQDGRTCGCPCETDLCDRDCAPGIAVVQVAAGVAHACAITRDGALYCWGNNEEGQLGLGAAGSPEASPAKVGFPVTVSTNVGEPRSGRHLVSAGLAHTCAIGADGGLYCWGQGTSGQLGTGDLSASPRPRRVLPDTFDWIDVSAGARHTCGIRALGGYCWGANEMGQSGDPDRDIVPTPLVLGGQDANRWGLVSAGWDHSCRVSSQGQGRCWGSNAYRQLGAPVEVASAYDGIQTKNRTRRIVAGDGFTAFIRTPSPASEARFIYTLGRGEAGQLGLGEGVTQNNDTYTEAIAPADMAEIAAGARHLCAVHPDGRLFCTGANELGELGLGDTNPRWQLTALERADSEAGWVDVSAGADFTCGLRADGTLYCWGDGSLGRLGIGDSEAGGGAHPRPERVCLPAG